MSRDIYTNEISQVFHKIYLATQRGTLDWEPTANPNVLSATLGEDYSARIALVSDFEGNPDENDHIISLLNGKEQLLQFDRRDFDMDDLRSWAPSGTTIVFQLFKDIWSRAELKSKQLDKHLSAVNKLLNKKISPTTDESRSSRNT